MRFIVDEVIPRHVTVAVTSNVRNPHQVAASMPLTGIIIILSKEDIIPCIHDLF